MSDGSETNDSASVRNEDEPEQPHIHILKGRPTTEEVAALVAVLGCVGGGAGEPAQPERTRWGLPVDRLQYAMSNYQRLTLQQMTHMKQ